MDYKLKNDWTWEEFKDYYEDIMGNLWDDAPKFNDIFEEDKSCNNYHCFHDEDGSNYQGSDEDICQEWIKSLYKLKGVEL